MPEAWQKIDYEERSKPSLLRFLCGRKEKIKRIFNHEAHEGNEEEQKIKDKRYIEV